MIRAVCDTNVLASGLIDDRSTPGLILVAWSANRFTLLVSTPILTELEQTLHKPYFRRRLRNPTPATLVDAFRDGTEFLELAPVVARVATDPEDDLILATAAQGHADYLVTGDRQLQLLGSHAGVAIVSPRGFLDALERG